MQASDLPRQTGEEYFVRTAQSQPLTEDFGTLNALPKEIISSIFDRLTASELNSLKLVSSHFKNMVDSDREAFQVRRVAIQNFNSILPISEKIFISHQCTSPWWDFFVTTHFILDEKGTIIAFEDRDKSLHTKDENGFFKKAQDFSRDVYDVLELKWDPHYPSKCPATVIEMPEGGFVKKVAEDIVFLSKIFYTGIFVLAFKGPDPFKRFVHWRDAVDQTKIHKIDEIFAAGIKKLRKKQI
ncbi:F-box protein [Criblamydia sequanensis]|uniref:F-box domain-containing protein n=1 Tax=Candidatus Criblamydia sequanensis CRIB-18 TaxID=1437425 RepID=A0A090D2P1_9BACT|nr:F-box protein [Criblamydia sequanensis]CDR34790.1 F-box domain-containing protein [Criblamydia sequanensis CRIB-18]